MSKLTKEDKLRIMGEIISSFALRVANEEISTHQKANPDAIISAATKNTVQEQAVSELMFRSCYFRCQDDLDEQDFREFLEKWIISEEEAKLRNMCRSNLRNLVEKETPDNHQNLSFSELCHRHIEEEWKNIRK